MIRLPSRRRRGCGRASTVRCFCIVRRLSRRLLGRILQYMPRIRRCRSLLFFVVPLFLNVRSRRPPGIFQYYGAPAKGRRRPDVLTLVRYARTSSTRHTHPSKHHTSRSRPPDSQNKRAGRPFAKRSARRDSPATRAAARSLVIRRAAGGVAPAARRRPSTSYFAQRYRAMEISRRWLGGGAQLCRARLR